MHRQNRWKNWIILDRLQLKKKKKKSNQSADKTNHLM